MYLKTYACANTGDSRFRNFKGFAWRLEILINPSLAEHNMPCLSKQCRSRSVEEANWSGSALFVIKYVNFYLKPGSSNLIGWKLEVGVVS